MLALFSPAFFAKVVGACLAVLWNVKGKKNGRQLKCKRNVHYSIIGLGHSFKACERLITRGDFILVYRGVASFSTSCKPGWLSLPHILKIARMTIASTHWLHQYFELFTKLQAVGPGLQVYGLATPLVYAPAGGVWHWQHWPRTEGKHLIKTRWKYI